MGNNFVLLMVVGFAVAFIFGLAQSARDDISLEQKMVDKCKLSWPNHEIKVMSSDGFGWVCLVKVKEGFVPESNVMFQP